MLMVLRSGDVGNWQKRLETMACRLCQNDFFRDSCLVTATNAFHGDELFLRRRFYLG